jgi:hypothetical protein
VQVEHAALEDRVVELAPDARLRRSTQGRAMPPAQALVK